MESGGALLAELGVGKVSVMVTLGILHSAYIAENNISNLAGDGGDALGECDLCHKSAV